MIFTVVDKKGNVQRGVVKTSVAVVLDRSKRIYASLPNHLAWSKLPEAKVEK